MSKKTSVEKIKWLKEPEDHDYPAAASYLSLIFTEKEASTFVERLKRAVVAEFKAKDVFRALRLPLLDRNNYHVKKDMKRIVGGKSLSPVLLVRDSKNGVVIIADGYHRMCAAYQFDEDVLVPCKIV
jgi:hypothetical protein